MDLLQGKYSLRLEHLAGMELWIDQIMAVNLKTEMIVIQAENYYASHDIGGQTIQRKPVSGCSSGYVLYGLDTPGEWTRYSVSVKEGGTYQFNIRSQGYYDDAYGLRITLTDITGTETTTWGAIKNLFE